jgi:hypothetical protein
LIPFSRQIVYHNVVLFHRITSQLWMHFPTDSFQLMKNKAYFIPVQLHFNSIFPPNHSSYRNLVSHNYFPSLRTPSHKYSFNLIQNVAYFTLVQLNLNSVSRQIVYHISVLFQKITSHLWTLLPTKISFNLIQNEAYFTIFFSNSIPFSCHSFYESWNLFHKITSQLSTHLPIKFNFNWFKIIKIKFRFMAIPPIRSRFCFTELLHKYRRIFQQCFI